MDGFIPLPVYDKPHDCPEKLMEQLADTGLTFDSPKYWITSKIAMVPARKRLAAGCPIEAGSLTSILNRMEEKV